MIEEAASAPEALLRGCEVERTSLLGFSTLPAAELARRLVGGASVHELPGNFALSFAGAREGRPFEAVVTSAISAFPYYVHGGNGRFVHGPDVFEIARRAALGWSWNERALNCMALMDHCIGDDTLHRDIDRARSATLYLFADRALAMARFAPPPTRPRISLADAVARFDRVFDDYCEDRDVVLSLSAGHDSRALLARALKRGRRPTIGTMGDPQTTDMRVATAIARDFGLEHRTVELHPDAYLRCASEVVARTSGTKSLTNWSTHVYIQDIGFPEDALHLVGANGELFRSYYFDKGMLTRIADLLPADFCFERIFAYKYAARRRIDGIALNAGRSSSDSLAGVPKACREQVEGVPGTVSDKCDHFYAHQRVRHFIAQGMALYAAVLPTCAPFLDAELVETAARLPRTHRLNARFHHAIIRENCPRLLEYPCDDTGRTLRQRQRPLYWWPGLRDTSYVISRELMAHRPLREIVLDSPHLDAFLPRAAREAVLSERVWQAYSYLVTLHFVCERIA